MWISRAASLAAVVLLPRALGADVLKTNGFSDCSNNAAIKVNNVDVSFDRSSNMVTFDVSGSSSQAQKVTASLVVTAYGKDVYQKDFDPCDESTKVDQLCPVPAGPFSARGSQSVPSSVASQIPSIAFSVPDLEGQARLELKARDGGDVLACIKSDVSNGKSVEVPAVSYVAAGVATAALALSALGAVSAGGHPGSSSPSPAFSEVMWWFQGMAMNGMHSVQYPAIYRSFSKNFAFSTGLVPWAGMQISIDNFRKQTGGNLTQDSYGYLRNATLVYSDGSTADTTSNIARRGVSLLLRALHTDVNGISSGSGGNASGDNSKTAHLVHGIQGYAEQLTIPQTNTFMTVLLIFAIVVAVIVLGILLLKVILEAWALYASFPKNLVTFRKEYWMVIASTITNLILLLYGVWVLYCIFQFTHGDSWAAKLLAGITLGVFTAILGFYTFRICSLTRKFKKLEGDESALYENKDIWKKYKLFYENYKKGYWWLFIPVIVYMFAKGCVLAAGDGHGLVQTCGQLIIEALMLILLLWSRPYNLKAGNWINIIVQVVRVLSVACILVFVEELGIAQSTKTITGVVLIAVQSGLTAVLAILIAVNSIIVCCRENPHRKRRKEAEKALRNTDDLTPLDGGDSYLMKPTSYKNPPHKQFVEPLLSPAFEPFRHQAVVSQSRFGPRHEDGSEHLVTSAASMGSRSHHHRSLSRKRDGSVSPAPSDQLPTLPRMDDTRY